MSEERRISLAELLAREGGAPAAQASGRRRRHRGGENSVTVAELTGEIPVVRDDQPAPGTEAPAQAAEQVQPAEAAPVAQPEQAAEPAQAAPKAAAPEAEATAAADDADEPITSSFLAAAVADAGAAEDAKTTEDAETPEAVDVETEEPAAATPAAEASKAAEAPNAPQAAQAQAEQGREQAWSRWEQPEAPIMATADFNTAQVRERQSRFAEVEADDTVDVAPVSVPQAAAPATPDTAALSAEKIDDARAENVDLSAQGTDTDAEKLDGAEDAAEKSSKTGKGRGWLALVAEVVLGLAAGAGLFYGFFKLWNWGGGMATIALTVVLAFIVIIGIVTFTHYLRKTTDYLTLGLALFVGLVITFGPLLMALGSN